jgi:hypothetical protein
MLIFITNTTSETLLFSIPWCVFFLSYYNWTFVEIDLVLLHKIKKAKLSLEQAIEACGL